MTPSHLKEEKQIKKKKTMKKKITTKKKRKLKINQSQLRVGKSSKLSLKLLVYSRLKSMQPFQQLELNTLTLTNTGHILESLMMLR